jgi:hypothetical protein
VGDLKILEKDERCGMVLLRKFLTPLTVRSLTVGCGFRVQTLVDSHMAGGYHRLELCWRSSIPPSSIRS